MSDPLKPSPALLCKLGSMVVHADEAASDDGHTFDMLALKGLADDPDVREWIAQMCAMGMLPVRRN